jgi:hypothetical protein
MTPTQQPVLDVLRSKGESSTSTNADGTKWICVCLDNAQYALRDMSPRSFAGHLSKLQQAGFYRPIDSIFGDVRLDN